MEANLNNDTQKSSNNLVHKECSPCEKKSGKMLPDIVQNFKEKIDEWSIIEDKRIEKTLKFADFKSVLDFVNKVGKIAEQEKHHPNIFIHDWNKVTFTLFTHSINGLSENDFILASKIDEISRI